MPDADGNQQQTQAGFERIVSASSVMSSVFDQARRAACVDATVLLTGESGTGKELVAEAIHHNSPRCRGPFVAVNMAAIPETLVESELFGHVEGAFTGGGRGDRAGRFEAADSGTAFIDEIGDMKLACQAKLLRSWRTIASRRWAATPSNRSDVRIIAATNHNLERLVAAQEFREDLYYRLNVVASPAAVRQAGPRSISC